MADKVDVKYRTDATATGGREGHSKTADGKVDVKLSTPKELGGGGGPGTNPEQLFAAGYSACFLGALRLVAGHGGVELDEASGVTVRVGIGKDATGYGLTTEIIGYLPGLEPAGAEELMRQAAAVCPYSKATRGNVEATLLAKV